jgi:uncharacterized protein (UPF0210 family)
MPLLLSPSEILDTVRMFWLENLNIRATTLAMNIQKYASEDPERTISLMETYMPPFIKKFIEKISEVEERFCVPIVNKRLAVTPIAQILGPMVEGCDIEEGIKIALKIASSLDKIAEESGVDYVGGYSTFVHRGFTKADTVLIESLPQVMSKTQRVCGFVNVATTHAGINFDAISLMGDIIRKVSQSTPNGIGCAKFTVFANTMEDTPFMPGAFASPGGPDATVVIGISGPGVIKAAIQEIGADADIGKLADEIKAATFKVTRAGELIGRQIAKALGIEFGAVDISLAPDPNGGSVAEIIQAMGLEECGGHGSIAALAILADALKKGGAMASSYVGGLSGVFIPVMEDAGMCEAAKRGAIDITTLHAMSSVCALGLDMVLIPGDTSKETISAIIADQIAIAIANDKPAGVRIIPVPKSYGGEMIEFGGLMGKAPVLSTKPYRSDEFIKRGGRTPAPFHSLRG